MIKLTTVFTLRRIDLVALEYEPTNTGITLKGNDIKELCNHTPVYIVVDKKVRVLECGVYQDGTTYLIAGKEV